MVSAGGVLIVKKRQTGQSVKTDNDKKANGKNDKSSEQKKTSINSTTQDLWSFLERNTDLIAAEIRSIGWKSHKISPDNIINNLLTVESEVYSEEQVQGAYNKINEIVAKAKEKVKGIKAPEDKLKAVYQMLKEDFNITFAAQDNAYALFIDNLTRKEMDCDTTTFLFMRYR